MRLLNFLPTINETYHDPKFMVMFESYLSKIKKLDTLHYKQITNHEANKFQGDFYGLLDMLRVDKQFHYMVMRVNGYSSPDEFDGSQTVITIPPLSELELMRRLFATNFR